MSGKQPPPRLVDVVATETEGVPLFVQEVYRYLDEQGRLFTPDGSWRDDVAIGEVEVPEGVRLVLGRRLERLSEGTRRVLTQASVIGRDFGFEMLAASAPRSGKLPITETRMNPLVTHGRRAACRTSNVMIVQERADGMLAIPVALACANL